MKNLPMPDNRNESRLRNLIREKGILFFGDEESKQLLNELGDTRYQEILTEEGFDPMELFNKFINKAKDYFSGLGEIHNALNKEKEKIDELLNPTNTDALAKLLIAHLRLEYVIEQILLENFKNNDHGKIIKNAKLSFAQKLKMVPTEHGLTKLIVEIISEINKLRNCFVHNIKFDIHNFRSKVFDKYFKERKYVTSDDKLRGILELISVVEMFLLLKTPAFKNKMQDIVKDYPILKQIQFYSNGGSSKGIEDILSF